MTTNKNRLMTSAKPCKLNPNERAYAIRMIDAKFARASYDRKYSEVQPNGNYRIKLAGFRQQPGPKMIGDMLRALREVGYYVEGNYPTGMHALGSRRRTDYRSIVFMFTGVKADNNIKLVEGYNSDGMPIPKAPPVVKLAGGKKKVIKLPKRVKSDPDPGMLVEPNRDHTKNNGLPRTITASMLTPLTIVMVQWRDSAPTPVMIYDVDLPLSRRTERPIKNGEIDFRGLDEDGRDQRFVSTQVLSIVTGSRWMKRFMQDHVRRSQLSTKLNNIYEFMKDDNYMVSVEHDGHGDHEVVSDNDCVDEVGIADFGKLERLPGVERRLVMLPGCAPGYYLVHENNELAKRYEVELAYASRPNDPIEFRSND